VTVPQLLPPSVEFTNFISWRLGSLKKAYILLPLLSTIASPATLEATATLVVHVPPLSSEILTTRLVLEYTTVMLLPSQEMEGVSKDVGVSFNQLVTVKVTPLSILLAYFIKVEL
jgi:hypothetical protein